MEKNLISVKLYPIDVKRLAEFGFTNLYGLDPIDPELQLGRSQVPENWMPIFCYEDDRSNFPEFYAKRSEEWDDTGDQSDNEFVPRQHWYDCWYEACSLRYVPEHWTVSSGDYLHVFDNKEHCFLWLKNKKNHEWFLVRDPSGARKEIRITIELVDPS